jgi:uncharacterized protein
MTADTQPAEEEARPTHEGVAWMPWGEAPFRRARLERKLIVLDSGATWCHWCHVMDRVTYEDDEVIRLLNERFIPVRIDRDRLPDIDAHYQRAEPIVRSQGNGWPLTVIITPEGHTLFKATFLPPRIEGEYMANVGLIDLLEHLDRAWRERGDEIVALGEQIALSEAQQRSGAGRKAALSADLVSEVASGVLSQHDATHGGFGGAPKFFASPALELLLTRAWQGHAAARAALVRSLDAMARGGVYDQIGGGFHRYSVDERWHVPHFEKMAYDNAALLSLYASAAAMTGDIEYDRIARGTLGWIARVLTSPDGQGFFASQDADVGLSDDGDYFTWSVEEARSALGADAQMAIDYWALDPQGDMHGRSGRNVLHVPKTLAQFAALSESSEEEITTSIESARERLLRTRQLRATPKVDKTVFADLNGMMIDAHLTAWERLDEPTARTAALASLGFVLDSLRMEDGAFAHYRDKNGPQRVGLLADQAWMALALTHAYAATLDPRYLAAGREVGDYVLANLIADDGGFLSGPTAEIGPVTVTPPRGWEDSPSRSAASVMAEALALLSYLTGEPRYARAAGEALGSFAGTASRQWGTFLGGYALAVDRHLEGPRTVVVIAPGRDATSQSMIRLARESFVPGGIVLAPNPSETGHSRLLSRLGYAADRVPVAYVCRGKACLRPAYDETELRNRLAELAPP